MFKAFIDLITTGNTSNFTAEFLSAPWKIPLFLVSAFIAIKISIAVIRFLYVILIRNKNLIYLKIQLPREDSSKDNEKKEEKDFKEKIAIMEQLYRNLNELSELNLYNMIRNRILHGEMIGFEMVAQKNTLEFYIVIEERFRELVEKQITAYYTHANIEKVTPPNINPSGNRLKMYYAYLKRSFFFPIKTYKTLENDPLNDLSNIFSKLSENEVASMQIILRPRKDNKWRKKAENAGATMFIGKEPTEHHIPIIGSIGKFFKMIVSGYKSNGQQPNVSGPYGAASGFVRLLQTREEVAKQIGVKANQVAFDTIIRITGSSINLNRATEITNNFALGLNLFKDPQMNWFQTRRMFPIDWINTAMQIYNYKQHLLDTEFPLIGEKKSLLVAEELASIFHFPCSRYNQSPVIKWLDYKILPAPTNVPTQGILLGHNVYRGEKREIRMLRNDRTRHHYCIGKSGSGKSVFLSYLARQDILNGDGVCVIDPHGDLIEELIQFVPKERAKDTIIFNPGDTERPMGLNILEGKTPEEMDMAASQATEIFIKIFGDEIFGPRIQHYFRNACLTLMEDKEEGATLIDVPRIFVDTDFMKYKVSKVTNPVVKSFWEHEYANTGEREKQEMIPYFSAKFGPFITNSIIRNIIGQPKSAFNIRECMDSKKILLINLSKGKIGDLNTQLLGLVVVARLQMAAMSRVDIPESQRSDFYLYVDEFQNFATDSFCSILSEARKYHLAMIMANQYIKQLEKKNDTSIRDAVFGNVGTMMSFKVGADDGEYLAKEYAPVLTEQDIILISNYKAYIKLNINNTTSRPFSLETIYDMSNANPKIGQIVNEYSRIKFGRKKEFVDQEIQTRIGIDA